MMGKVRKASKQKFRTPEGFRYASQRPEAFGKGIEYKPEGGYDPVKRRDTIAPRNVGTAKGRSRNETITGQPMVTYSTDPFEATDIQLKKEQDHHKELCAKIGSARPYSSATCANRAFGKVENEPETDKPLYAKDNTRPWTRSGPFRRAVKGGEMFCPVPDLLPEPYDDVARRRAALPLRRQPVRRQVGPIIGQQRVLDARCGVRRIEWAERYVVVWRDEPRADRVRRAWPDGDVADGQLALAPAGVRPVHYIGVPARPRRMRRD